MYNKESEGGIRFDDKTLDIDWKVSEENIQLSAKDKELPTFDEYRNSL